MAQVFPGRYTAKTDATFVVFLIGMRVNHVWKPGKWIPVARTMPPMIEELKRHPELDFLHSEFLLYWRGVAVLQYWRSFEALHAFAHMKEGPHLPAWAEFNRCVGNNGAVGIWHETYQVQPGQSEAIHVNMPRWGLMNAIEPVPVAGRLESAKGRMGRAEQ